MPKRRSIESYGVGQSGYTAGRIEDDPSLGLQVGNQEFPRSVDEDHAIDLGLDERFVGVGGKFPDKE